MLDVLQFLLLILFFYYICQGTIFASSGVIILLITTYVLCYLTSCSFMKVLLQAAVGRIKMPSNLRAYISVYYPIYISAPCYFSPPF